MPSKKFVGILENYKDGSSWFGKKGRPGRSHKIRRRGRLGVCSAGRGLKASRGRARAYLPRDLSRAIGKTQQPEFDS